MPVKMVNIINTFCSFTQKHCLPISFQKKFIKIMKFQDNFNIKRHLPLNFHNLYILHLGDPPLPMWAKLQQTTVSTSVLVPSSTPTTNRSTIKLPVTHTRMTSPVLKSSSTTSHTSQIKTGTIPTTTTTKTTTTTTKPCPEESRRRSTAMLCTRNLNLT